MLKSLTDIKIVKRKSGLIDDTKLDWHTRQIKEFLVANRHCVIETHIVDGKIVRVVAKESRLPPKND